ncbi:hypothetical protein RF11_04629 [Thelohanellus kitauei]|uniref:Uncharacterized protein n=1 Tax=Thelohanellus kitauei TaxID=669202 RepID=A0A0C2JY00_THEKT|nr:hypothetical protein RF11_04629 [Thelohanellus kitauei]
MTQAPRSKKRKGSQKSKQANKLTELPSRLASPRRLLESNTSTSEDVASEKASKPSSAAPLIRMLRRNGTKYKERERASSKVDMDRPRKRSRIEIPISITKGVSQKFGKPKASEWLATIVVNQEADGTKLCIRIRPDGANPYAAVSCSVHPEYSATMG